MFRALFHRTLIYIHWCGTYSDVKALSMTNYFGFRVGVQNKSTYSRFSFYSLVKRSFNMDLSCKIKIQVLKSVSIKLVGDRLIKKQCKVKKNYLKTCLSFQTKLQHPGSVYLARLLPLVGLGFYISSDAPSNSCVSFTKITLNFTL